MKIKTFVLSILAAVIATASATVYITERIQTRRSASAQIPSVDGEKEFIRHGILMQEYILSGVSSDRFSEELAELNTDFRLLETELVRTNPTRCRLFKSALFRWNTTEFLWKSKHLTPGDWDTIFSGLGEGYTNGGTNFPEDLQQLGENLKPVDGTLNLRKLINRGLKKGSSEFQEALDLGPH